SELDFETCDERRHDAIRRCLNRLKHGHVNLLPVALTSRTVLVRRLAAWLSGLPALQRRHRVSGGGGTDFVAWRTNNARAPARSFAAAKLEGPPALHSHAASRHARSCRAEPPSLSQSRTTI